MSTYTAASDSAARWQRDVADYALPHARVQAIAALLRRQGCISVTDIGCAGGSLRTMLAADVDYRGVDFVEGLPAGHDIPFTSVDLNASKLAPIEIDSDWVVCSGVLEYVRDVPRFLNWLKASVAQARIRFVFTYFNETHLSLRVRRLRGLDVAGHPDWVRLMARGTFLSRLEESGFKVTDMFDLTRDFRPSPSIEKLTDYRPRLYRSDRWSSLLGHQWIIVGDLSKASLWS